MCGAPLKSIRKQLLPGVVFRDSRNTVVVTVLSVSADTMEVKYKARWRSGREEIVLQCLKNSPDNLFAKYTLLTFPKELRLEDVL